MVAIFIVRGGDRLCMAVVGRAESAVVSLFTAYNATPPLVAAREVFEPDVLNPSTSTHVSGGKTAWN